MTTSETMRRIEAIFENARLRHPSLFKAFIPTTHTKTREEHEPRLKRNYSEDEKAMALDMLKAGVSRHKIAEKIGAPKATVNRWAQVAGLMTVKRHKRISEETKGQVIDLLSAGLMPSEVARMLGISRNCAAAWKRTLGGVR